jgi:hypothetical protein
VKESLIRDFTLNEDSADAQKFGMAAPFRHAAQTFTLAPAD